MREIIDLTGMKFGEWTVLRRGENNKFGQIRWSCSCSCGRTNKTLILGVALRKGKTKSCLKCAFVDDLKGKKFGKLTVLYRGEDFISKSGKTKLIRWYCECDCGNFKLIQATHLKSESTISCGCNQKEAIKQRDLKKNKINNFALWGINNLGEDFLEKYWDYEKNNKLGINPWQIARGNNTKKVWIKCQEKDYHENYETKCNDFVRGSRCPYCRGFKIHTLDSLGTLFPQVLEIWSNKNDKSPFEYSPNANKEVWWKCLDRKHEDYLRLISNSNTYNFRCPECQYSKGEKKIELFLVNNNFIKNRDYIPQKEFSNLLGINNGQLSYDFYLPKYNLLIEYQGQYHDGTAGNQTIEEFRIQQEHDKRKKEYAQFNNINLLEIWYWDYDNIENILDKIIK